MIYYETEVVGWGKDALSMLGEESPMLVIFDKDVPEEVEDICILHEHAELEDDPEPGDTFYLGEKAYPIAAVGWDVAYTLREMGHCTLFFKDSEEPEIPSCMMLRGTAPSQDDIKSGMRIAIE